MAQKRKHVPLEGNEDDADSTVFQSSTIEDRSSTFVAYFSAVLSSRELQSLPEIKSASHKILAWRNASAQQSLTPGRVQYTAGHDDDGEKSGGKTVQKVLERMNVVGACVVARWYGGVMLGQVRFVHMEDCARNAVENYQRAVSDQHSKKQRIMDDENDRQSLLETLPQRDRSILVLRSLALEKETAVKKAIMAGVETLQSKHGDSQVEGTTEKTTAPPSTGRPSLPVEANYSAMPLVKLRAVDMSRDATISFLLKRIAKAETDLAAILEENPP
nr:impact family member c14c8.09c [Quercus suber]